jgi:uncharacterized protein (DUF302 family)
MDYKYKKKIDLNFDEALLKVKDELKKEGFGILTKINVKANIGVEFDNYIILGVCKPKFAYKVLTAEKDVGLLLPCNVLVYEDSGEVFVSAVNPLEAMSVVANEDLVEVALCVKKKLENVVDASSSSDIKVESEDEAFCN